MIRVLLVLLVIGVSSTVSANDRLAGSAHNSDHAPALQNKYKKKAKSGKNTDILDSFAQIEGLGLRENIYEGGLGRDLWDKTRRSEVTALLDLAPVHHNDAVVQDLVKGVLLSTTTTRKIENDVDDVQAGDDLLTLRLRKLNEMGAYQDAFTLYTKITDAPYHPRLIEQGIVAMILSGQKSLACVEARSAAEIFASDAFLTHLITLCDANWSKEAINTAIGEIESLKGFKSALLVATHSVAPLSLSVDKALKLPPRDVWPALIHEGVSPSVSAALSVRAYELGLMSLADLEETYERSDERKADLDIAALYRDFNAAEGGERWRIFSKALALQKTYGTAGLAPFAGGLNTPELLDSPTNRDLSRIYAIFMRANKKIPEKLFTALLDKDHDRKDVDLYGKLLTIAALSTPNMQKRISYINKLEKIIEETTPQTQFRIENTLSVAREMGHFKKDTKTSYENNLFLTFPLTYVIHSANTNKRLVEATQSARRGEVALLSIIVLNARNEELLYPEHLRNTLIGLSEVGLNNVARRVAVAGLLSN